MDSSQENYQPDRTELLFLALSSFLTMVCKLDWAGECEGGGTADQTGPAACVRSWSWFARKSDWPENTSPGNVLPHPPQLFRGPDPEEEDIDGYYGEYVLEEQGDGDCGILSKFNEVAQKLGSIVKGSF